MSDTAWPPSLTRTPRVSDLEESAPKVVIRSEVDVGPAKIRRRLTGGTRSFSVELDLTRNELATFDTFFTTTTKGGSLSFSWKNPRTGTTADFRFLNEPSYRPRAPRGDGSEWWVVSFQMEMLPTGVVGTPPSEGPTPPGGHPSDGTIDVFDPFAPDADDPELEPAIVGPRIFEADSVPPSLPIPIFFAHFGADGAEDSDEDDSTIMSRQFYEGSSTSPSPTPNATTVGGLNSP